MKKINIAIIGTGHLGSKHLKVYRQQLLNKANIVGICDIKPELVKQLSQEYQIKAFDDYRKLLGKVDAVNICTPTVSHFEIAEFFLTEGVHCFIEKPMTLTVSEAENLIEIAQRKKLKLQIGHVERFNAAFKAISGLAQDPLFVECHRLNPFSNRSLDIGVVMDLMIHDIDIILGLVSAPIQDIQAVGVNVLTNLEDIANSRITFNNGCVCNLTASRVSDEVMRKIRIFLKDTYISLDYVKQEAFLYKKNGDSISKTSLPIEKEEPLKSEIESFLDCIIEDKRPIVSGIEGKQALELALAISQKIWQKTNKSF